MQRINVTYEKNVHPILCALNINAPVIYSIDNSAYAFYKFLEHLHYKYSSVRSIKLMVARTHKKYPVIGWLQKKVDDIGIIRTAQEIDPSSARGSTYLHFLMIIGLLSVGYDDYFNTNPKTILKIDSWMEPYKEVLGIEKFANELRKIASTTSNRCISCKIQTKLAYKVGIYLVIRYKLNHIVELTFEQWQEFMIDCRNRNLYIQVASVSLMHRALFQMGIIDIAYDNKLSGCLSKEKIKPWCDNPMIAPYYKSFLSFILLSKAKATVNIYTRAIGIFFEYLLTEKGKNFTLDKLSRADINGYITYSYTCKNKTGGLLSFKTLEGRFYSLRAFLTFISENKMNFKRQGFLVFNKKIVVNEDFKIKTIKHLPRPIEKKILDVLKKSLIMVTNVKYRLLFSLMLSTGIAIGDALILKYDCLKYSDEEKRYFFFFYRRKIKKQIFVPVLLDTVQIIKQLQMLNTQNIPMLHMDGSYTTFLFNDGGKALDISWTKYRFEQHKLLASKMFPEMARDIMKISIYQIRHTFASNKRDEGKSILELKMLMGHSNVNTTMIYVKENDKFKVELIKKLEGKNYYCEGFKKLGKDGLQGEKGAAIIDSMIHHENKFSGGRCTVYGFDNCKNAYRCITCPYLCTTVEDIPELVSIIEIQYLKYQKLRLQLECETEEEKMRYIKDEIKRIRGLLQQLHNRYKKISEQQKRKIDPILEN